MSQLKVNTIRHTGASSDAVTLATDGTCTAKITNPPPGNRNLILNGAMNVHQRGGTSTAASAYCIDGWKTASGNTGVTVTTSRGDLSSSDTPYTSGLRKYLRVALSGAGTNNTNSYIELIQRFEGQDIATSGWNYLSDTSYITLSFWFRCSTNQTFYAYPRTDDGTNRSYAFSFTAGGNNTWTKITKTFPGSSTAGLQIDNDNASGLSLFIIPHYGTDLTTSGSTINAWKTYSGSDAAPDYASTWLTAGASTFDITGVQLEVGDTATDFEHRSYGDELRRCMRYYWQNLDNTYLFQYGANHKRIEIYFPVPMRTTPTYDHTGNNITIDSGSHQNEGFFCAYSASDYDGPGRNYSNVKFSAEL